MNRHIPLLSLILSVMLVLCACGQQTELSSTSQPTTVPTVPETTEPSTEEITEPIEVSGIPEILPEYHFSFFMYLTSPIQSYFNFYVAPAGTEDWYLVHKDSSYSEQTRCSHPKTKDGNPEDTVIIFRAYIEYDGPEVTAWTLRAEYLSSDESTSLFSVLPFDCQWDTTFELKNNQTLLCLGVNSDYTPSGTQPNEEGSYEFDRNAYVPMSIDMEFCENCPEYWKTPVETTMPEALYEEYSHLIDSHYSENSWWIRHSMCHIFDDPGDMNLFYLFYSGFPPGGCGWNDISDSEREFLLENNFGTYAEIQILPRDQMDEILQTYFGITLEDIRRGIPEQWVYFEETDCYYTNHNDTYVNIPNLTSAEETDDGLLKLYYDLADWDTVMDSNCEFLHGCSLVLTLRPMEDGTYQAVSNQLLP